MGVRKKGPTAIDIVPKTRLLEYAKRVQRVKDVCRKYNLGGAFSSYKDLTKSDVRFLALRVTSEPLLKIRTNRDFNMSACYSLKAGSNSVLAFLFQLPRNREKYPQNKDFHISSRTASMVHSFHDYQKKFRGYFLFTFVRHPFSRLVSLYRDRILHHYMLKNTHPIPGQRDVHIDLPIPLAHLHGQNISFRKFIRIIINSDFHNISRFDHHWVPMWQMCAPCHISYNFVGKVETMMSDFSYLSSRLGLTREFKQGQSLLWQHQSARSNVSSKSLIQEYIAQLTHEELSKLYKMYQLDFELYDYNFSYF
ncbi:carbohydrate sulfotransferase 11-like [Tachypleus tridentatus]|uniref:carbohydrate sulfotransferase 11-like n=1 Tax=Tachypleus tridentatus TaxID=6853 RepID=UPI003FD52198